MTEQYLNNPLHSLKLEVLVTELVDHYGWEILAAAMNFNCFKTNPTIKGSVKFLRKTEWARHKLEAFYLYKYKNLPRPDAKQYELPPRDRIVPEHQKPREPVEFTLEELAEANERKAKQAAERNTNRGPSRGPSRGPGRNEGRREGRGESRGPKRNSGNDEDRSSQRSAKSEWKGPKSDRAESRPERKESRNTRDSNDNRSADIDPWAQARENLAKKQRNDD